MPPCQDAGLGYNCNIPLNRTGNTDWDYLHAWHQLVLPLAARFRPELVLVSAGFDPAVGCPEGEQEVSPACFAHLAHSLVGLGAPLVALLEGGYFPPSLAEGAALTLRALLGDPCPALPGLPRLPNQEMVEAVRGARMSLAPHWPGLLEEAASPPSPRWEGPASPDSAPFDTMCPTPARSPEEDARYTALVAALVQSTDLGCPPVKLDCGPVAGLAARVLAGQAGAARLPFLAQTTIPPSCRLLQLLVTDQAAAARPGLETGDVLQMVLLHDDCGWRLQGQQERRQEGQEEQERQEQEDEQKLRQLLCQHILPAGYTHQPDLAIVFWQAETPVSGFLLHQLHALARIILVSSQDWPQ